MRTVPHKIVKEWVDGKYNQVSFLQFRDKKGKHKVEISAGSRDFISTFREGEETFVLSINYGFPTVGLEVFAYDSKEGKIALQGEVFLQGSEQVEEILGKNGEQKAEYWIAKVLSEYID